MQVYIWEVLIYHVCNSAEIFIRWSTHWFKVIIHIPEEWKGEEVHFRWNSASEAMVIIYYILLLLNKVYRSLSTMQYVIDSYNIKSSLFLYPVELR